MLDRDNFKINPWHPITDKRLLKFLGKLGEEATELGTALFRCIIQGVDEVEPDTQKPNRQWVLEEIADTLANCELVIEELQLDEDKIDARKIKKKAALRRWHEML